MAAPGAPRSVPARFADWFVRRWEDLSGSRREAIRLQGELARTHLETRRERLAEVRPNDLGREALDEEYAQTAAEIHRTVGT